VDILDLITDTDAEPRPRRIVLYGTHGIGKSTFAACAPDPIFVRTEDGLRDIKGAKTFPLCTSIGDVFEQVAALQRGNHNFKTFALDSADWAEQLIWKYVCESNSKQSMADFGFGKGYESAASTFRILLDEIGKLNEVGMTTVLIAHCKIERFENPATEAYDRYTPKLHKHIVGLFQEWADEVLFATYKVFTKKEGQGFDERRIAMGTGERVIYTTEKPSHMAKNRLALPEELPLAFSAYWEAVMTAKAAV
jgi:hypothetical protein